MTIAEKPAALVIGIGNPLHGDNGAGSTGWDDDRLNRGLTLMKGYADIRHSSR